MTQSKLKFFFLNGAVSLLLFAVSSCNGILSGIYDEPKTETDYVLGDIIVDATNWKNWYYIDFPTLEKAMLSGNRDEIIRTHTVFEPYPIPESQIEDPETRNGQYLYWFDVFGEGLSNHEFRSFTPTLPQPEPEQWSIALHRNNVRTNGGSVFRTSYSSLSDVPDSADAFANEIFTEDEWSETDVWDDQSQLLSSLMSSQGIKINKVLSAWLTPVMPPPPRFIHDSNVFIIRMKDGSHVAIRLKNYMNNIGTKCWMTIEYKSLH